MSINQNFQVFLYSDHGPSRKIMDHHHHLSSIIKLWLVYDIFYLQMIKVDLKFHSSHTETLMRKRTQIYFVFKFIFRKPTQTIRKAINFHLKPTCISAMISISHLPSFTMTLE